MFPPLGHPRTRRSQSTAAGWRGRRIGRRAIGVLWAVPLALLLAGPVNGQLDTTEPSSAVRDGSAGVTSEGATVDYRRDDIRSVVDFTGLDRPEERASYYGLLNHARTVPLSAQRQRARDVAAESRHLFESAPGNSRREFRPFAEVVLHPERFRGLPITLSGHIQRLDEIDAGENDFGMVATYQAYLFTGDSRPLPWVIVATQVDADLPRPAKGRPTDHVVVTGYFHKLWRYETADGHWAAPLILAGRIEYRPLRASPAMSVWQILLVVAVVAGMIALATGGIHAVFSRRNMPSARDRLRCPSPETFTPPETPLADGPPES
jgi:hypothetical protein